MVKINAMFWSMGLAVSIALAAQPTSTGGEGAAVKADAAAKADVAAVAQAGNAFGFELYAKLRGQEGNLFLSPASIHTALAMTYAGAAGGTARQMADALRLELPGERLHAAFGQLANQLNHPPDIQGKEAYRLVVSNALWMQKGYPFKESFTSLIKRSYEAGLNSVDFSAAEPARKTINAWVEKATQEKIKDLIPPGKLDRLTVLVLTNAIYFKSDWADPFSEHATRPGEFHLNARQASSRPATATVPLMTKWLHGGYMETEDFQLADLPYKGEVLSMTILLPRKADGLEALEKKLSAKELAGWIDQAKATHMDLTLPRFKFTSEFELNKPLAALGMADAFDGRADFSGMTTAERLFISAVLHKAFVAVDEKGTEAAAATAVVMALTAMPQPPSVVFRADRPFLFLVRHRPTGTVLFLGRLSDPPAGPKG